MDAKDIYQHVQERYAAVASGISDEKYGRSVAKAFGYTEEELASIPQEANLGVSCGNPLALAHLREGETVVDLGSGAGFDVFLAARKVGPKGQAIGVDMNKQMLAKANLNKAKTDAKNVSFVESGITKIALPDSTADCIVSNCVVNLVPEPEKPLVFNEMFRLLAPGGRLAISDILIKKDLPPEMKADVALYVGCVAGASQVSQYAAYLREAGFEDVLIVDSKLDLNVYTGASESDRTTAESICCGQKADGASCQKSASCCSGDKPEANDFQSFTDKYKDVDLNEWAGSFQVYAVKPPLK